MVRSFFVWKAATDARKQHVAVRITSGLRGQKKTRRLAGALVDRVSKYAVRTAY